MPTRKMSPDQVIGPSGLRVCDCGALDPPSACSVQAEFGHQPFDGAAGHLDALTAALKPYLARSVDRVVLAVHTGDLNFELLIADLALGRLAAPGAGVVVGGRRDLATMRGQHTADRLDAVLLFVSVDVVENHRLRRSSSAAKKVEADFRMSLARFSSRFSARNRRSSSAMSLVTPGRTPESI